MPVTVESVAVQERMQELKIPVVLEPSESVDITAPDDVTIEKISVTEGDKINTGDTIIKLAEYDFAQRIARKKADIKDAQANVDKNTYLFRNRDRLLEEGRIDKAQYDTLESESQASEAQLEKFQSDLAKIEERSLSTTITSPAAGIVGKVLAMPGTSVANGKTILSIARVDPINITFRLPSGSATTVKPGMAVRVKFPELASAEASAKITTVGAEIDPRDNTFIVKAALPNPSLQFKSGMRAEVQFTSSEKQRLFYIPEDAIIKERRGYFVFIVLKGVAHKVQVIPNETLGNRIEIVRGLSDADLVVVKGHDKLTEGTVVDIWGR